MEILVMKQCYKMLLTAVCMAASSYAITVQAADWTISQSATVTTATPTLNQGNTGSVENSTQSINGIALEPSADSLISGSQTATINASTSFELIQGGSVTGAKQSVNDIVAQNIAANSGDSVTQLVEGTSTALKLEQKTDGTPGGDNNRQSLNAAAATGTVNSLQQEVSGSVTLRMEQNDIATGGNIQSVNFASGNQIGSSDTQKLEQSLSFSGSIVMQSGGTGDSNMQAGNIALVTGTGTDSQISNAEQSYTASAGLDINQGVVSGTGNIQALNLADTKTNNGNGIGGLDQDIMLDGVVKFESQANSDGNTQAGNIATAGTEIGPASTQKFTQKSGTLAFTMSGSGASNTQAGNLARAGSNIDGLSQTFDASLATSLSFNMAPTAASNVQAGNMVVIGTGVISDLTQLFTGSATANDFIQATSADNLIQAGNLIVLGTGSLSDTTGPHQAFTATGAVDMTQRSDVDGTGTGGANNLQALNAVVDTTGGTSAVNLVQTLSAIGLSFVLTQNGVADSGQFGNFAGLRY